MAKGSPRYRIDSARIDGDHLCLRWQDGHNSRYPGIWLLEACNCEVCGNSESAVRSLRLVDKPARPVIEAVRHDDDSLEVDWDDRHHSRFDLTWLRHRCLSSESYAARQFRPTLWDATIAQQLPYMEYPAICADTNLHHRFLQTLLDTGFVILRGVPAELERTAEIAGLVGKLRMTNYEIYELKTKPNPELVADLSIPLSLHTDEPYRLDPPGITFFHVIQPSGEGGDSTLADSFRLADELKRKYPSAFEILCRVSASFHRDLVEGRRFEYQHPVIQLDRDGAVSAVRLLDRGMAPVDCALDDVEPFYDALRLFLELAQDPAYAIQVRLESGEMLVFNNQRLMHGRTAFDPAAGRHVRTCHVDLDEFHSRLRVTYRERGDPRQWMTFRKA